MTTRRCGKCGGELKDAVAACPACGALMLPADSSLRLRRQIALRSRVIKLIGIAAVLSLAALLLVSWLATRQVPVSTPVVDQVFNLDEIRAKAEAGDTQA